MRAARDRGLNSRSLLIGMDEQEALRRAKKLPPPTPGMSLDHVPIEVFCKWMEMHRMQFARWKYQDDALRIVVEREPEESLVEFAEGLKS